MFGLRRGATAAQPADCGNCCTSPRYRITETIAWAGLGDHNDFHITDLLISVARTRAPTTRAR